jgi:glutaminase
MDSSMIEKALQNALLTAQQTNGGKNADYIPALAEVDSSLLGIAICDQNGRIYSAGDVDYEFAIESISKAFNMAYVMSFPGVGPTGLRKMVGADPTGMPFNSIVALELDNAKPCSPLVNAGAMSTVSIIPGNADEKWRAIIDFQSALAGRTLKMSQEINQSEQKSNFRNRALCWIMKEANTIYSDPMESCEAYTRGCSTVISCKDLAIMAGVLVNGIHPVTKHRLLSSELIPPILAELTMEGLYMSSGDWLFSVGLPGKSGVGGGIFAVSQKTGLGIAAFSPRLDETGNSVRAQVAIASIAKELGLHIYQPTQPPQN